MYYALSMAISLFTFIMTITKTFADEESYIHRMFGDTETFVCIGVAVVLVAIGMIMLLIGLLFFANRIVYIIPKYRVFENDKAILLIGLIMIHISILNKYSIKEILKFIIDRL